MFKKANEFSTNNLLFVLPESDVGYIIKLNMTVILLTNIYFFSRYLNL